MSARPQIAMTLTATRRLDPLQEALKSLTLYLLPHFDLRKLYVTIDPIYGTDDTCAFISRWFDASVTPGAGLYQLVNETPSHGAAIKWLWGRYMLDKPFLHWEDDFIAYEPITPARIHEMRSAGAGMGAFDYAELGNRKGKFRSRKGVPAFGTSPRFVGHDLGAAFSLALDPTLCPEKQTYEPWTPEWQDVYDREDAKVLILRSSTPKAWMIGHLGDEWNKARGIRREVVGPRIIRTAADGARIS